MSVWAKTILQTGTTFISRDGKTGMDSMKMANASNGCKVTLPGCFCSTFPHNVTFLHCVCLKYVTFLHCVCLKYMLKLLAEMGKEASPVEEEHNGCGEEEDGECKQCQAKKCITGCAQTFRFGIVMKELIMTR